MKHPWLIKLERLYSDWTLDVYPALVLSLKNPRKIMEVSWGYLSVALPEINGRKAGGVASDVCSNGWEFDDDTRQLRHMFQQMVNHVPEKDLEEYM